MTEFWAGIAAYQKGRYNNLNWPEEKQAGWWAGYQEEIDARRS